MGLEARGLGSWPPRPGPGGPVALVCHVFQTQEEGAGRSPQEASGGGLNSRQFQKVSARVPLPWPCSDGTTFPRRLEGVPVLLHAHGQ